MSKPLVIITGASGMLGRALQRVLNDRFDLLCTDRLQTEDVVALDITDKDSVNSLLNDKKPFALINCAAYTNVDGAEEAEGFALAKKINGDAVGILAEECKQANCHFVHISTDYVFGVNTDDGFTEDTNVFAPINKYGESKLIGEQEIKRVFEYKPSSSDFGINTPKAYLIRTSWLFGHGATNFISKIIELAGKLDKLKVVEDEISTPVFVDELGGFISDLLTDLPAAGIYHGVAEGHCSRYEFAQEILRNLNITTPIEPVPLSTFPRPAKISNSSFLLNTKRPKLATWQEMVKNYISQINQ